MTTIKGGKQSTKCDMKRERERASEREVERERDGERKSEGERERGEQERVG